MSRIGVTSPGFSRKIQQLSATIHQVAWLVVKRIDGAADRRANSVFHFHGFHHQQWGVRFHLAAHLGQQGDDGAVHGGRQVRVRPGGIGLSQIRGEGYEELPLVTCGDDLSGILGVTSSGKFSYTSSDVIDYLLPC